ncbi:MAG: hypothetical protein MJ239_02125 [Bacilli bacterium]|nr:hypothetical protein [Bacilli bacterium]
MSDKRVKRKIAETDFLEENLPQTRSGQFKDILKINFRLFLELGLILLGVFALLLAKVYFSYYFNAVAENSFKLGHISEEEKNSIVLWTFLISEGANVLLYPPVFIVLAGVLRIVRQLCYTEGIIFSYDFKQGVKDNWAKFLFIGLFFALGQFIVALVYAFMGISFLSAIPYALSLLLVAPTFIGATYFFSTYENKLGRGLLNSMLIHLRASWRSLLLTAVIVAPVILIELFLGMIIVKLVIYSVLIVLCLPIVILAGYEMYLYVYDTNVNVYHFPEAIRRGLYISEKEKESINQKLEEIKGGKNEK